jgi:hypothetical protein
MKTYSYAVENGQASRYFTFEKLLGNEGDIVTFDWIKFLYRYHRRPPRSMCAQRICTSYEHGILCRSTYTVVLIITTC